LDDENLNNEEYFKYIWNGVTNFEIPDQAENICPYAAAFLNWADRMLESLNNPDVVSINQAKIQLTDKFFEWHSYVPRAHQLRLGVHGHTCIFQVFDKTYEKLHIIELSITPPLIFIPISPPTPPPEPPNIAGLFIGEDPEPEND